MDLPPNGRVEDGVGLVFLITVFQGLDAGGPVVLQLSEFRGDGEGGAGAVETGQRKMVVQRDDALRIVETFHVLTRLRVVSRTVHVLPGREDN